ncbi:hypothetical protein COOONC_13867 [Cooperia oncophora]
MGLDPLDTYKSGQKRLCCTSDQKKFSHPNTTLSSPPTEYSPLAITSGTITIITLTPIHMSTTTIVLLCGAATTVATVVVSTRITVDLDYGEEGKLSLWSEFLTRRSSL